MALLAGRVLDWVQPAVSIEHGSGSETAALAWHRKCRSCSKRQPKIRCCVSINRCSLGYACSRDAKQGHERYNMSMYPEVRVYSDPFEGLKVQLTELRGLIKIVPPLIEADRERRWSEIGERPSDGEDGEIEDVYAAEAGPEEGWGFADFGRTIRVAAVVFAWAVFQDYLAHELRDYLALELKRSYPTHNVGSRALRMLLKEDARNWDRRFDHIKKRYEDFAGIALNKLPSWHQVLHAQELRNALVHNQGQYTRKYLDANLAYRPTEEDLPFMRPGDRGLINREVIPLSLTMADAVISQLSVAATEVREAIDHARLE